MEIQERITRANQAREVLDNALYIEAYDAIKQEILEQWQNSPARDTQARETLYLMIKITDKLQATMQAVMETGKLAELDLNHQQTLLQKAKKLATKAW